MKKLLLLLGTICGLAFVIPVFSMGAGMDTSDDDATVAHLAMKTLVPRGVPAPIRNAMVKEFGISSDSTRGMSRIISAMNETEKKELYAKASADISTESDSEDTEDDIHATDEELDFLDAMVVDSKPPKLKPKNKKRSEASSKHTESSGVILASCTECSACLYENNNKTKNGSYTLPLRGQKTFYSRMEKERCKNYPQCIVFHEAAKKYYKCCYCPWLLTAPSGRGTTKHMNQKHPGLPHVTERLIIGTNKKL